MTTPPHILVVAATARELATTDGWTGVTCGVGPIEAAVHATQAIARYRPDAVLQVGIAGARRRRGMPAGTLVIGTRSLYTDLGLLPAEWAVRDLAAPLALVEALRAALPAAVALPIGTSARVGGTVDGTLDCDVEAMEGFGVLRAAHAAGVPAIEVRAISNDIEEADRAHSHFARAFDAITSATPALVRAVAAALGDSPDHA
jgi:nucleoside phosphorylase